MFTSAQDAKKAGWFSRRHETRESHDEAVKNNPYTGGHKNRVKRVSARVLAG